MDSDHSVVCVLCQKSEEDEVTGALSTKEEVTAHQNCLLYSSGLFCHESPQFDDLFGFSAKDVLEERKRGRKLVCCKCKKKGATVGCENKRCKKSYHYPCAIQAKAEPFDDKENGRFGLYCLQCRKTKLGLNDNDSDSPSVSNHNPKRKLDFSDCDEKKASKFSRIIISDDSNSDATDAGEDWRTFAPLESDVEENVKSGSNEQLDRESPLLAPGTCQGVQTENQTENQVKFENEEPSSLRSDQSLLLAVEATDISMDSSNFWKDCVSAGCTKAIFNDFIREMKDIFTRITSDQASKKDCDVAFNVIMASGKLEELVARQQKDFQKKQTDLQKADAALKRMSTFLRR